MPPRPLGTPAPRASRPEAPPALRAIEHWIVRACRRATRLRGLRVIALARRLGFLSALKAPPWMLPDPDLSERVHRLMVQRVERALREGLRTLPKGFFGLCAKLVGFCAGRSRIPRHLEPA